VTVVVPHHTTVEEAIGIVDRSANGLFDDVGRGMVELVERKQSWNGSLMDFSLTAQAGFISLPISGTVVIDEINVTLHCELPVLAKNFLGEEKIRADLDRRVRAMLFPK
jgi:hypothetical protein